MWPKMNMDKCIEMRYHLLTLRYKQLLFDNSFADAMLRYRCALSQPHCHPQVVARHPERNLSSSAKLVLFGGFGIFFAVCLSPSPDFAILSM
jgi:hypothetical protein